MPLLDDEVLAMIAEIEEQLRAVELVEEDGENMESEWHRLAMNLLIESIRYHLRRRDDFYVGGNMFIYFNEVQARNRDFRGPDFFFVKDVPKEPLRRFWLIWQEGGRYPDVIVELISPRTARGDRTTKKDVYERIFHTHEYYCYDPQTRLLEGWRLLNHRYEPMAADERGWLWSEELQLWLGTWDGPFQEIPGTWPRFYEPSGDLVQTFAEGARQEAAAARQQADTERKRAEALAAELAALKARLTQPDNASGNGGAV